VSRSRERGVVRSVVRLTNSLARATALIGAMMALMGAMSFVWQLNIYIERV